MQLNQITLPVNNMVAAVRFYQTLGCVLVVDTPHYARLKAPTNNTTLSLALTDDSFVNGAVIYFETDTLDADYARLRMLGVVFDQPPTDQRYLWREARLRDPSNNQIKLFYAGDNRLNPPWAVAN